MITKRTDRMLSLRSALVFALATCIAVGTGVLTWLQVNNAPAAFLAAGASWAGAVAFLDAVIAVEEPANRTRADPPSGSGTHNT